MRRICKQSKYMWLLHKRIHKNANAWWLLHLGTLQPLLRGLHQHPRHLLRIKLV